MTIHRQSSKIKNSGIRLQLFEKRGEKGRKQTFFNVFPLNYDSRTIKLSIFKVFNYGFRNIQKLVIQSLHQITENFCYPPKMLCQLAVTPHIPISPKCLVSNNLLFLYGFNYYGQFIIVESRSMPYFLLRFLIYHEVLKIYDQITFHYLDISHFDYPLFS